MSKTVSLEIVVPEGYDERTLRVFGGMTLLAVRRPGEKWLVMTQECCRCGTCCTIDFGGPFATDKGLCGYLEEEPGESGKRLCALGLRRPFACCVAERNPDVPHCTVRFEEA